MTKDTTKSTNLANKLDKMAPMQPPNPGQQSRRISGIGPIMHCVNNPADTSKDPVHLSNKLLLLFCK